MDYLGTTDYLTSPVSGKVEAWTHYNEWGLIVHNAVLKCGQRELDLVKRYATHDYDSVLELYYAKARFYDAHDRHFTAIDPILDPSGYDLREYVQNPVQFVQYLYVINNPIVYIDILGLAVHGILGGHVDASLSFSSSVELMTIWDDEGNKVVFYSKSLGASTNASIGAGVSLKLESTASNVFEFVYGYSMNEGFAVDPFMFTPAQKSVVSVGVDTITGSETNGDFFTGYVGKGSVGVSAAQVELHVSYVTDAHIVAIKKYHGKWVPQGATIDYFDDLDCKVKEKLKEDLDTINAKTKEARDKVLNSKSTLNRTHSSRGGHRGRN